VTFDRSQRALTDGNVARRRSEAEIKKRDDIMSDIGRSAWTNRVRGEEWLGTTGCDEARIERMISRLADEMKVAEVRFVCSFHRTTVLQQIVDEFDALLNME
jgi:hypothetical protein